MQRMKTDEHNQHTINNAIVGTNQGIVFYFSNSYVLRTQRYLSQLI